MAGEIYLAPTLAPTGGLAGQTEATAGKTTMFAEPGEWGAKRAVTRGRDKRKPPVTSGVTGGQESGRRDSNSQHSAWKAYPDPYHLGYLTLTELDLRWKAAILSVTG
jgi:hypothetical protein